MSEVTLKVEEHYNENRKRYDEAILQGAESFLMYYKEHYVKEYLMLMKIVTIKSSIDKIVKKFPNPQCYLVASILCAEFEGYILYNSSHCIFVSDGNYYDKRGAVDPEEVANGHYLPLIDFGWGPHKNLIEAMLEKHGI